MTWIKHNPAFLSDGDARERFVVREHELATILQVVRENSVGETVQHILVTAPRGMGKSMLVRRVQAEIRTAPDLSSTWFPVVFGQESYAVSTPGELWLEALLHVADATGSPRWRDVWEALRTEQDERRLAEVALARLLDFSDSIGKRLLLMIESFDALLADQITMDAAWSMRKVFGHEPRLMFLCTAVRPFDGTTRPEHAFFEIFRRMNLLPLDEAETASLWSAVAEVEVSVRRGAGMRVLTGGNPRLVVLMAEFARDGSLKDLVDDLTGMIDEHTDYFKHTIEALPPKLRRVYLALATLWTPSTSREVAAEARLDLNETSAMLSRLEGDGRVEVVAVRGRAKVFQLSERLYNLYYLLRRRGPGEPRVRALIELVRVVYEADEVPRRAEVAAELASYLPEETGRASHLLRERMAADVPIPGVETGIDAPRTDGQAGFAQSDDLGGRFAGIGLACSVGDLTGGLDRLEATLKLPQASLSIGFLYDLAVRMGAMGEAQPLVQVLRRAPKGVVPDAVLMALELEAGGEGVVGAMESMEVAAHLRNQMRHLAHRGDIWFASITSLSLTRPEEASREAKSHPT